MIVNTTKESVCLNQIVGQKNELIEIEQDAIVPDIKPDVLSIIATNGNVCIYKKEILDGKIRIDGAVQVYIIYLADSNQGSVRGISTNLDFTKILDMEKATANMNLNSTINIKSMDVKVLNGRKINVKTILEIDNKIYANDNIEIIKEIENTEGIQKLSSNIDINSLIGQGTTKGYAKDTVVIDNIDNMAEILNVTARIINKDKKTSYNKVLTKADVYVKIMYLTEDNRINSVSTTIPVMGFIDIQNVNEDNICDCSYEIKNLVIKPNQEDNRSIYVEAEVEMCCVCFEKKQIEITEDLYSTKDSLNFTKKEINTMCGKFNIRDTHTVKEKVPVPEMIGNKICDTEVKINLTNTKLLTDRINYEGEAKVTIMFAKEDMSILDTKVINLPINFSMEIPELGQENIADTNITVSNQDFVLMPDGFMDIKITMEFEANISSFKRVNVIDQITKEDLKDCNNYSMVVYFVKPGDTLWKIAKKFGSTIEDIARVNNIENVNNLQIGRQLFIPKYTREKSA